MQEPAKRFTNNMILKQRFTDGRTNYTEIGSDFQIETPASPEWDATMQSMGTAQYKTDVIAVLTFSVSEGTEDKLKHEPIYKDFRQWLYTDAGKLFLTLS